MVEDKLVNLCFNIFNIFSVNKKRAKWNVKDKITALEYAPANHPKFPVSDKRYVQVDSK